MENIKLQVEKREKAENVKDLLKSGYVPAVVYGPHLKENKLVKIKTNDLRKTLAAAGESTLVDMFLNDKEEGKVLFKDIQRDAVTNNISHVDLYEVDMNKEIITWIPLQFIGESKAVKEKGGALIRSINEVEVKCLPGKLVNHIEVDISFLDDFDKTIKINDLVLPEGMKLTHETNDAIANIAEPKAEEEVVPVATEGEAAATKTEEAPKKE